MLLHQGVGLGQRLEAVFRVAQVDTDIRQQGAQVWDTQRCPGGPPGGDPLADLGQPRLALALHGQRPPTHARSLATQSGKPCSVESVTAASACSCAAGTSRRNCEMMAAQPTPTPDYRDAPARVPTPGPHGGGPGLAAGYPSNQRVNAA